MPYAVANLTPHDPTDLVWAVAWCRFYLRDTSDRPVWDDAELEAVLAGQSFTVEDVDYYRPHEVAASLIESDANRKVQESLMSWSATHRQPDTIARGIRAAGGWIDNLIRAESGEMPDRGGTLDAVF